ncbi:hypothetical protein HY389_02465, partial [Candidatus Daviesbacteria bacterium]|nr:hypothetical protein [Candidatus Daviesbacteria bacterium]
MKKIFHYWQTADRFVSLPLLVTLVTVILITFAYLIFYNQLPNKLPLFYSLPWGEKELVAKPQIFILPAVAALISLVNTGLAYQLHPAQIILKRILLLSIFFIDFIII